MLVLDDESGDYIEENDWYDKYNDRGYEYLDEYLNRPEEYGDLTLNEFESVRHREDYIIGSNDPFAEEDDDFDNLDDY